MGGLMNKMNYFRLIWKNHRSFAIFSMVFITLLQFLILYLITTFNMPAIIQTLLAQMPAKMKIYLSENFFSTLTLDGAAAFGFNHPLVLTLLAMNALNIPALHISREMESGSLELLLAHPFRRQSLILKLWISGCLILLAIILAAITGSLTAIAIYHHLTPEIFGNIMKIGFNLWLLFVLILSYTLMITVFARTGSKAGNYAAILTLVFYLLFFLSQLWDDIKFTTYFNIFSYYEPQKLMFGKSNFTLNCVVLSSLIIICFFVSRRQFIRRNIP
jgi:ABC-type transport system involved in multi-copper enzyme maturation permease subunit